MSYDRSIASYKAGTPLSAIWCFLFQFAVSSIFLKFIHLRRTSSSSSSCYFYPSLLSFLQKRVVESSSSPDLCEILFIFDTIGTTDLRRPSPPQHSKHSQVFLIYFLKCPKYKAMLQTQHFSMRDFRLTPRSRWELRFSGLLRSE
jgi:hypothetical protein